MSVAATAHGTSDRVARRWTLLSTVLASSLVIIDVTAMNVIVPDIQADLDATVTDMQWVVASYTLFLASVTLTGGALADRYGRKRILVLGTTIFAAASLAAGLAPDPTMLIAARAVQGFGGALLAPASLSLLGAAYAGHGRGRAIGVWSGASALMAVLGPVLGGVLSDLASWRWIFFLNVPLGALILVPLLWRVKESKDAHPPERLDLAGAAFATAGLGLLTTGIIRAGAYGWRDAWTITALVLGAVTLLLFVGHEHRTRHPMLPLRIFRHRDFSVANVLTFFVYAALAAGMFFVPMRLILLDGHRPIFAGFAMLPVVFTIALLSPRMGGLSDRHARTLLILGPVLTGVGYLLLARPGLETTYWTGHFPGLLLVGIGMSLVAAPVTNTVLASVPERHVGLASGVNNAVSRMAALFAIALAGAVALGVFSHMLAPGLEALELTPGQQEAAWGERTDLADATPPAEIEGGPRDRLARLYDEAFLTAYRVVQATMGAFAFTGAGAALFLRRGTRHAP